jgi:LAO/AO transport system kinase
VDTTLVALVPEAGDGIQTMKAGLMEIADIFVVNKADRPGADRLVVELESMLMLSPRANQWQPPILATQAINDVGIEELYREAERHQEFLASSGELLRRRRQQRKEEFLHAVEHRLRTRLSVLMSEDERLRSLLGEVENGDIDPYSAAEILERGALPRMAAP